MNKVMLVGRLTRDPELRSLPSGKPLASFVVATNEYRGGGGERTEYHNEGRLQTRQWDDDAGLRHWKTEVVASSLEMLSGRGKKDYAKEVQAAVAGDDSAEAATGNGSGEAGEEELAIAM
jgi:single-strand DNA-binding protein